MLFNLVNLNSLCFTYFIILKYISIVVLQVLLSFPFFKPKTARKRYLCQSLLSHLLYHKILSFYTYFIKRLLVYEKVVV